MDIPHLLAKLSAFFRERKTGMFRGRESGGQRERRWMDAYVCFDVFRCWFGAGRTWGSDHAGRGHASLSNVQKRTYFSPLSVL